MNAGLNARRAQDAGVPAIEFRSAGFSYAAADGTASVRDVSLRVSRGECVVITGPSGCGKTTLTRMVNGLIPAVYEGEATGEVLVEGRSIAEWVMDDLSCAVGSVFQNPRSQFFNLDTTSEIAFGCENMGVARDEIARRVRSTVEELGIAHLLERDIRALSGGEKQLVAVASVHAMHPATFVFDEPTAALDVRAMLRLREVIKRMKAAGKTVLIAEHRLWWLAGVVDRVVLMRQGTIIDDMDARAFAELSNERRAELGLRAWDIADVKPSGFDSDVASPSPGSEMLAVRGLSVRYGKRGRPIVDGCDFEAHGGRAVALIGRNGAGKTTLGRCLAGLHAESSGIVCIGGEAYPARKRAGEVFLGMQESGYQLFSDTVEGELRLALEAREETYGEDRTQELVDEKLADFGLTEYRGRHPLSLSGGQRQRLALAAGFLQGARVMVLDEPTSGLDLTNMQRIASQIDRLKEDGVCLVIVTHDFEFACATCDEIALMEGGRIVDRFDLTPGTASHARALFGFEQSAPGAKESGSIVR